MIAKNINLSFGWWLLEGTKQYVKMIYSCLIVFGPRDQVFFEASVTWGLVGRKRIFEREENYSSIN